MKKNLCIGLLATLALTATAQQTITVSVSNTSKSVRTDEPVVIPIAKYGDISFISSITSCIHLSVIFMRRYAFFFYLCTVF